MRVKTFGALRFERSVRARAFSRTRKTAALAAFLAVATGQSASGVKSWRLAMGRQRPTAPPGTV